MEFLQAMIDQALSYVHNRLLSNGIDRIRNDDENESYATFVNS